MPGRIATLTHERAVGWAAHPRLPHYRVIINVVHRSMVIRSVLADRALNGQAGSDGSGFAFTVEFGRLGVTEAEVGNVRFIIGETDEQLPLPEGSVPAAKPVLAIEDILALAHGPRSWVTGETFVDAVAAGLRTETIVDLLYRDYLGRPADPNGLGHYTSLINNGVITFDDIRRGFVDTDEFRMRRKYADNAPGTIFSEKIVVIGAKGDFSVAATPPAGAAPATALAVDAGELAKLDGAAFVSEVYRRLLQKEADPGGMAHYLHQIGLGMSKMDVIRRVASELEAITLGVRIVGLEEQGAAAESQAD